MKMMKLLEYTAPQRLQRNAAQKNFMMLSVLARFSPLLRVVDWCEVLNCCCLMTEPLPRRVKLPKSFWWEKRKSLFTVR